MSDHDDEPELAGYTDDDGQPLRSRRRSTALRAVVIIGLVSLILPGLVTTVSVATASAGAACAALVRYSVPDASGSSARFQLFGEGGIGWQCYSVGAFGGDRHVAPLGLIPGRPPAPQRGTIDT